MNTVFCRREQVFISTDQSQQVANKFLVSSNLHFRLNCSIWNRQLRRFTAIYKFTQK